MIYDELVRDLKNEINFLELREDRAITIGSTKINGPLDLPILSSDLIKIVKEDIEDFPIELFLKGIVYIVALEPEFKEIENYKTILNNYTSDIKSFIFNEGLRKLDESNYKEGLIYLKALLNLGYEDSKILFALGRALENQDISFLNNKDKEKYVIEIMNIYERIVNNDPEFYLAHYKLGYIYREYLQFLKSELSFEKYLKLSKDDIKKQEVRNIIDQMEGSVLLERAINDMNRGEFSGALDKLNQVREEQMTHIHYYHLSVIYLNIGELKLAKDMVYKALEKEDNLEYHNQLALIYQEEGREDKAILELENIIERSSEDFNTVYNLATLYYRVGELDKALSMYKKAYEINPVTELSQIIIQVKEELEFNL